MTAQRPRPAALWGLIGVLILQASAASPGASPSSLQPAYGAVAVAIVILALLRPVRSHCEMRLLG